MGASAASATAVGVSTVATVASAAVGGYAQYRAGESADKAAKYNAEMDRRKATDALQRGAIEAGQRRDRARRVAAAQAEGIGMSGVSTSGGTALQLLTETASLGELDALTAANNATREAWGFEGQAKLTRYQGRMARQGGYLNAAGTFLGGASSAARY